MHSLKETPLRPAPLRSPGKPANCFAVESFTDELSAAAGIDPIEFRLRGLKNPRGIEVIKRMAALMKWQTRPSPGTDIIASIARGRGMSYVHYKHSETFVAMGMEVAVERASGRIKVEHVACAHDCGQIINPDGVHAQVEGSILQTISRVLLEEVKFDRSHVLSVDWSSYPILNSQMYPSLKSIWSTGRTNPHSAPERRHARRSARRSPTPYTTRRACGCAPFRSRRSA